MTTTNHQAVLASYISRSSVSYEFCSEIAAKLFAEWWNPIHVNQVHAQRNVAFLLGSGQSLFEAFVATAEAFNAAAQHAAQIAGGE
jgi:hypothetical protein